MLKFAVWEGATWMWITVLQDTIILKSGVNLSGLPVFGVFG